MVHCKSKDNDIGVHVLKPHENIQWNFHLNFFQTTQFYCAMKWGEEKVHWFDIYIPDRDFDRCIKCSWGVKQNGPCFYDKASRAFDICYQWNPGR
ncbi:unnamed protein product [Linum tenue]|uniref:S-protein homolog n=2 Tax=Linum tenue TaxID=586396 RepID=A0AAV0I7Q2_9ROSI|nr:unnamed protein product [Linum tenue]